MDEFNTLLPLKGVWQVVSQGWARGTHIKIGKGQT